MVSVECGSPDESTTAILNLKQHGEPQIAGSSTPTWSALKRTGQFMMDLANQNRQYVAVQDWGCTIEPTGPNETAWLVFENFMIQLQPVRKTLEPIATWSPSAIILQWPVLFAPPCYFLLFLIHLNIAALVHQHLARYWGAISYSVLDVAIDHLARHYLVDAYDGWYNAVCRRSSFPAHLDPPKEWAKKTPLQPPHFIPISQISKAWCLSCYPKLHGHDWASIYFVPMILPTYWHQLAAYKNTCTVKPGLAAMKSTGSCGGWTRLQALPVCYLAGRHVEPQLKTLQRRRLAALKRLLRQKPKGATDVLNWWHVGWWRLPQLNFASFTF